MWPSLNSMTISTSDNTFTYFSLCLFYAFRIAYVTRLGAFVNVVKMESGGMFIKTAINTSVLYFVGIYPPSNVSSSVVGKFVCSFPVFWYTKSCFSKFILPSVIAHLSFSLFSYLASLLILFFNSFKLFFSFSWVFPVVQSILCFTSLLHSFFTITFCHSRRIVTC